MSSFGYNVLGFGANANSVVLPSEDEFNRVSFLSHFDGANNGVNNAFDDGSTSNHTITANGNVTQGSFGPFARPDGEWSINFDNSSTSLLYFGMGATGSFDGNFTIEGFFYARTNVVQNSVNPTIIAVGDKAFQIYLDVNNARITLTTSQNQDANDNNSKIIESAADSITLGVSVLHAIYFNVSAII